MYFDCLLLLYVDGDAVFASLKRWVLQTLVEERERAWEWVLACKEFRSRLYFLAEWVPSTQTYLVKLPKTPRLRQLINQRKRSKHRHNFSAQTNPRRGKLQISPYRSQNRLSRSNQVFSTQREPNEECNAQELRNADWRDTQRLWWFEESLTDEGLPRDWCLVLWASH